MLHQKLPTKLGKEPLIDAVFEIRFDTEISAAEIMPGFLHSKLGGEVKIDRLPVSQLPLEIRQKDPNLMSQPLVRITWENQLLMVGDRSLAVGCVLPYPGWNRFREVILKVTGLLSDAGIVRSVDRYSIKYVDMLAMQPGELVGDWVDLDVKIGESKLKTQSFQLHMEVASEQYLDVLLVGSPAQAHGIDGSIRQGMIVSVDTMAVGTMPTLPALIEQLPGIIDDIHKHNKRVFFECLTTDAVKKLEPVYD